MTYQRVVFQLSVLLVRNLTYSTTQMVIEKLTNKSFSGASKTLVVLFQRESQEFSLKHLTQMQMVSSIMMSS